MGKKKPASKAKKEVKAKGGSKSVLKTITPKSPPNLPPLNPPRRVAQGNPYFEEPENENEFGNSATDIILMTNILVFKNYYESQLDYRFRGVKGFPEVYGKSLKTKFEILAGELGIDITTTAKEWEGNMDTKKAQQIMEQLSRVFSFSREAANQLEAISDDLFESLKAKKGVFERGGEFPVKDMWIKLNEKMEKKELPEWDKFGEFMIGRITEKFTDGEKERNAIDREYRNNLAIFNENMETYRDNLEVYKANVRAKTALGDSIRKWVEENRGNELADELYESLVENPLDKEAVDRGELFDPTDSQEDKEARAVARELKRANAEAELMGEIDQNSASSNSKAAAKERKRARAREKKEQEEQEGKDLEIAKGVGQTAEDDDEREAIELSRLDQEKREEADRGMAEQIGVQLRKELEKIRELKAADKEAEISSRDQDEQMRQHKLQKEAEKAGLEKSKLDAITDSQKRKVDRKIERRRLIREENEARQGEIDKVSREEQEETDREISNQMGQFLGEETTKFTKEALHKNIEEAQSDPAKKHRLRNYYSKLLRTSNPDEREGIIAGLMEEESKEESEPAVPGIKGTPFQAAVAGVPSRIAFPHTYVLVQQQMKKGEIDKQQFFTAFGIDPDATQTQFTPRANVRSVLDAGERLSGAKMFNKLRRKRDWDTEAHRFFGGTQQVEPVAAIPAGPDLEGTPAIQGLTRTQVMVKSAGIGLIRKQQLLEFRKHIDSKVKEKKLLRENLSELQIAESASAEEQGRRTAVRGRALAGRQAPNTVGVEQPYDPTTTDLSPQQFSAEREARTEMEQIEPKFDEIQGESTVPTSEAGGIKPAFGTTIASSERTKALLQMYKGKVGQKMAEWAADGSVLKSANYDPIVEDPKHTSRDRSVLSEQSLAESLITFSARRPVASQVPAQRLQDLTGDETERLEGAKGEYGAVGYEAQQRRIYDNYLQSRQYQNVFQKSRDIPKLLGKMGDVNGRPFAIPKGKIYAVPFTLPELDNVEYAGKTSKGAYAEDVYREVGRVGAVNFVVLDTLNKTNYYYSGTTPFPTDQGVGKIASVNKFYVGSTPTYFLHTAIKVDHLGPRTDGSGSFPTQGGDTQTTVGGTDFLSTRLTNPMTNESNEPITQRSYVAASEVNYIAVKQGSGSVVHSKDTAIGRHITATGTGSGIKKGILTGKQVRVPLAGGTSVDMFPREGTESDTRMSPMELRRALATQQRNAFMGIQTSKRKTAIR